QPARNKRVKATRRLMELGSTTASARLHQPCPPLRTKASNRCASSHSSHSASVIGPPSPFAPCQRNRRRPRRPPPAPGHEAAVPPEAIAELAREAVAAVKAMHGALHLQQDEDLRELFRRVVDVVTVEFEDVPCGSLTRSREKSVEVKFKADAFQVRTLCSHMVT